MSAASGVFDNPSAFETYLSSLTERLHSEREARIEFLTYAADKLTPLLDLAQTLQNEAAVDELRSHLAAVHTEMADLRGKAL